MVRIGCRLLIISICITLASCSSGPSDGEPGGACIDDLFCICNFPCVGGVCQLDEDIMCGPEQLIPDGGLEPTTPDIAPSDVDGDAEASGDIGPTDVEVSDADVAGDLESNEETSSEADVAVSEDITPSEPEDEVDAEGDVVGDEDVSEGDMIDGDASDEDTAGGDEVTETSEEDTEG